MYNSINNFVEVFILSPLLLTYNNCIIAQQNALVNSLFCIMFITCIISANNADVWSMFCIM